MNEFDNNQNQNNQNDQSEPNAQDTQSSRQAQDSQQFQQSSQQPQGTRETQNPVNYEAPQNGQNGNGSEPDYRQSSDSAQPNTGYPYSNGAPQNGGYYGSGYGGYNRKTNYVYNGTNRQYGNAPYNPDSQRYGYNNGQGNDYGQNNNFGQNGGYGQNNNGGSGKPPKDGKKGAKIFISCLAAVVVITVVVLTLSLTGTISSSDSTTQTVDAPTIAASDTPTASSTSSGGELTASGVYEKVKESSVGILVYSSESTTSTSGEGSGVIIGEDNSGKYTYIITCAHVISDGGTIKVQLYDETQYDATIVGYDSKTDIGVVRIAASGLTAIEVGDSSKLSVGETVYAIGNPGGVDFAGSFTDGIVSAIARPINSEIGYEMNCIQHTAAINPGNSGGALVNSSGQLIGINSSKISSTDYEGMGFAVPSSTFIDVYNEIIENGYVTNRPKLGIKYAPASSYQTYSMLVAAKGLPSGSLVISSIDSDSSLANTQVQAGDLITAVNGNDLETTDMLPDLIENSQVGDTLTLSICHFDSNYQATEFDVTVTLVEDKGTTSSASETTTSSYYNPFGAYGYGN